MSTLCAFASGVMMGAIIVLLTAGVTVSITEAWRDRSKRS